MSWARPQNNHVGGWIGFSPKDGYLYIDSGDGGTGNDSAPGHFEPGGNAQTITEQLDGQATADRRQQRRLSSRCQSRTTQFRPTNPFVGATTGDDEIWAYGLRNPFRDEFRSRHRRHVDRRRRPGAREEIDFEPATSLRRLELRLAIAEGIFRRHVGGTPCRITWRPCTTTTTAAERFRATP